VGGDAGFGFMDWSLRKGWFRARPTIGRYPYRAYLAGKVSERDMCGEMVQIYADCAMRSCAPRRALREQVCSAACFREMAALVGALIHAGVEIWASAPPTNGSCEGVRDLAFPKSAYWPPRSRRCGPHHHRNFGRATDEGKARPSRVWSHLPDAVFGNSVHDLAMLQIAPMPSR